MRTPPASSTKIRNMERSEDSRRLEKISGHGHAQSVVRGLRSCRSLFSGSACQGRAACRSPPATEADPNVEEWMMIRTHEGAKVRQAQPQCACGTLSIRLSHRQLALRSQVEVGQWRLADPASNVGRPLHPRRLCNRGRIQDDRATYTNVSETRFTWRGERSDDGSAWSEFMVVEAYRNKEQPARS